MDWVGIVQVTDSKQHTTNFKKLHKTLHSMLLANKSTEKKHSTQLTDQTNEIP